MIKNAAKGDYDPDADDGDLTDEEDIARPGGVTADDPCSFLHDAHWCFSEAVSL